MKKSLLAIVLGFALTACSTQPKSIEKWENFERSSAKTEAVKENYSRVTFYRANDIKGPVVNIHVNGRYQASVLPNAKTVVDVCSNNAFFAGTFDSKTEFVDAKAKEVNFTSSLTKNTYVKIAQDATGQLSFVVVESDKAKAEIDKLPSVKQTISRVPAQNCNYEVKKANNTPFFATPVEDEQPKVTGKKAKAKKATKATKATKAKKPVAKKKAVKKSVKK